MIGRTTALTRQVFITASSGISSSLTHRNTKQDEFLKEQRALGGPAHRKYPLLYHLAYNAVSFAAFCFGHKNDDKLVAVPMGGYLAGVAHLVGGVERGCPRGERAHELVGRRHVLQIPNHCVAV